MKKLITILSVSFSVTAFAQQAITLSDSVPLTVNGLKIGYNITNAREKEVGDKGNFSRYTIQCYVTNTSTDAKIILYKQGFSFGGNDVSPSLVQFNCLNATGARLTSKETIIQAKPCTIVALVDDKECPGDKVKQNKRPVQIGYWIKAGETISSKSIFITPLNEKPNMTAMMLASLSSPFSNTDNTGNTGSSSTAIAQRFVKLKNFSTNTYLNVESGPLNCTVIRNDWWSAQWEMVPVSGTNYYVLKNKWKSTFISTDGNGMLSTNSQSANSMWTIEAIGNTNTYSIKNAANNTNLINQNGSLQFAKIFGDQVNARWIIEE